MNTSPVLLAAFWAGLAAPEALYAPIPSYRPLIADLTVGDAFALVGALLTDSASEITRDRQSYAAADGEQLSFRFAESE
jgi:hypothetical protein